LVLSDVCEKNVPSQRRTQDGANGKQICKKTQKNAMSLLRYLYDVIDVKCMYRYSISTAVVHVCVHVHEVHIQHCCDCLKDTIVHGIFYLCIIKAQHYLYFITKLIISDI
jgi:hypothetical protein